MNCREKKSEGYIYCGALVRVGGPWQGLDQIIQGALALCLLIPAALEASARPKPCENEGMSLRSVTDRKARSRVYES